MEKTQLEMSVSQGKDGKDIVSTGNLPAFLIIALGNFAQEVLKACDDAGMIVDISMEIESSSSLQSPASYFRSGGLK